MSRPQKAPKPLEVSVDNAAKSLGVSERMVLNYIKAGRIQALRVGKRWFVDLASLEAFRQANGLGARDSRPISETSEISEISETLPKAKVTTSDDQPVRPRRTATGKRLDGLSCYRLCLKAFQMPMWAETDRLPYSQRLRELQCAILEQTARGFIRMALTNAPAMTAPVDFLEPR